jgi:hypothetical protein
MAKDSDVQPGGFQNLISRAIIPDVPVVNLDQRESIMSPRSLTAIIFVTLSFALSACQGAPQPERPPFSVSVSQNEALIDVMTDVLTEAAERRADGAFVSWNSLSGMLVSEDTRVQSILDEEQWENYDTYQREYLTDQLFALVDRRRFSYSNGGTGYSQPMPGITFSSPGM